MIVSMFAVQANAATSSGLKAAFDELNYSLSVDWDQQDKEFYAEQMKKFSTSVREMQADGLTDAEVIKFVKSEVKDQKVAKDLETAFNMISLNKMSTEDASKYMVETMKRSYSAGASWNGDSALYIGLGLLIVAAAVAVSVGGYAGGSRPGGSCVGGNYCSTTCYNDYYYGYTCYDDCYYGCY